MRPVTTVSPPRQILGLDAVRFLAALLVVSLHFSYTSYGWVGVEVFFVLSGFVIASSAEHSSGAAFLKSRILRLAPGVWICATLSFLVLIASGRAGAADIVSYIHSVSFWPRPSWISPVYWTLPIEIGFYAIVFLFLTFASFRWLVPGMILIGVWSTLCNAYPAIANLVPTWFAQLTLARFGSHFAAGIVIWSTIFDRPRFYKIGFVALFLTGCTLEIQATAIRRGASLFDGEFCFAVMIGLILLSAVLHRQAWNYFGKLSPLLRVAGLMTYPIYLLHYSERDVAYQLLGRSPSPLRELVLISGLFGSALLIALYAEPFVRRRLTAIGGHIVLMAISARKRSLAAEATSELGM